MLTLHPQRASHHLAATLCSLARRHHLPRPVRSPTALRLHVAHVLTRTRARIPLAISPTNDASNLVCFTLIPLTLPTLCCGRSPRVCIQDYSIPGLRNLTAKIVFTRGGEVQYYGTTFVGYVGLLTGMRPHAFSVSVNERTITYPNILDGPIDNILSALEVRLPTHPLPPSLMCPNLLTLAATSPGRQTHWLVPALDSAKRHQLQRRHCGDQHDTPHRACLRHCCRRQLWCAPAVPLRAQRRRLTPLCQVTAP